MAKQNNEVKDPLLEVTEGNAGLAEEEAAKRGGYPSDGLEATSSPHKGSQDAAEDADAAVNQSAGEAADASAEPKDERVPYVLQRNMLSSDKHQTVTLNGKNYQIEAGKQVMIPPGVAEILEHAIKQRLAAQDRAAELQNQ